MGKKLLFSLGLGAVAAAALSKLDEKTKAKLLDKADEKMLTARKRALQYRKYFKDYLEEKNWGQKRFDELKNRVSSSVEQFTQNERVMDTVTSVQEVSQKAKDTAKFAGEKVKGSVNDVLQSKVTKVEVPALKKNTDIVLDGTSAFGAAKAAAEFESDHPTETFFPKKHK